MDKRCEIKYLRRLDPDFWHRLEVSPYLADATLANHLGARLLVVNHLPRLLDLTLTHRNPALPDPVLIGRQYEPYPKQERHHRLTRRLIEVLAKYGFQAVILTRSPLILRDIDLLSEVNEAGRATVAVILPSVNRRMLKTLEPGTTGFTERRSIIDRIKRSGIQTGMIAPLGQFQRTGEGDLEKIFHFAAAMFLDFLLLFETNLPACPRHYASPSNSLSAQNLRWTGKNARPTVISPTTSSLKREKELARTSPQKLRQAALALAEEYRVPLRIKRYLPSDLRRENYWVAALLANRGYQRKMQGKRFRHYLKLAGKIDRMGQDIRTLIRRGDLKSALDIPDELWPDMIELTGGGWCDDEHLRLLSGERK
jgi:DNA repair photolyase